MGFLDFLKGGSKPVKSLEEYLNQRSAFMHVKAGFQRALNLYATEEEGFFFDTGTALKYCETNFIGKFSTWDAIPKKFLDTVISPETFFTYAYNKGSGKAAFYLGVLYEHGISVEKDVALANQYYNEALSSKNDDGEKSDGALMAEARAFLIERSSSLFTTMATDNEEAMAIKMFCLKGDDSEYKTAVSNVLNDKEFLLKEFILLGKKLTGFYAGKEYPMSLMMFGQYLLNADFDENYENFETFEEFDDLFVGAYPDGIKTSGSMLLERLAELATSGNIIAMNVVKTVLG